MTRNEYFQAVMDLRSKISEIERYLITTRIDIEYEVAANEQIPHTTARDYAQIIGKVQAIRTISAIASNQL